MSIALETYSDKSFIVKGDTKQYKESLTAMGGKWCANLKDKERPGYSFGAWIFWSAKKPEIQAWINGLKSIDGGVGVGVGVGVARVETIVERVARLELQVAILMEKLNMKDEKADDEDEVVPTRRLLK